MVLLRQAPKATATKHAPGDRGGYSVGKVGYEVLDVSLAEEPSEIERDGGIRSGMCTLCIVRVGWIAQLPGSHRT